MDIFSLDLPLLRVNKENKSPAESRGVYDARKGRKAEEFKNYNIGIACGNGLVVVDVDPRNGGFETLAAFESLHRRLPPTWTADTANRGRHYYFAGEMKSTSFDGIDIQSTGKYVIAPPSKYQYGEYMWLTDCAPWECELAPLPDWIKTLKKDTRVGVEIGDGQVWDGDFSKVLNVIKFLTPKLSYEDWLKVGMGLHWTRDPRAYETFVKWSRGDYFIGPERYENFSEEACAKKWNSFKEGGGITIGTMLDWCYTNRAQWENEQNVYEYEQTGYTESCDEEEPNTEELFNQIELPTLNSPFINQLITEIKASAFIAVDEFAYGAAFAIMSAVTQRGFVLDYSDGKTSTYSLILGPPACGKESYLNAVLSLVTSASDWLIADEMRSDQAMKQCMSEYPSRITVLDEFPDKLFNAFKPKAADNEYKVAMMYKELWSVKEILPGSRVKEAPGKNNKKNDSIKKVTWPMLSIFGAGTYDKFSECLNNPEFLAGGLLSRLDLWVIKERVDAPMRRPIKLSSDVKKKLKALFDMGCGTSAVCTTSNDGKRVPDMKVKMTLTESGTKAFEEFRDLCLVRISEVNPQLRSLYDRASEKALRYGMMIALGRGSVDVDAQDVVSGAEIAKHLVVNARNLLMVVGDTNESKMFKRVCEDLRKLCANNLEFSKRTMHQYSRTYSKKFKSHERESFWRELKALELISLEGSRGRLFSLELLDKFITKL